MTVVPLAVHVARARPRDDRLIVSVRHSYEGRPPARKKRVQQAKTLLSEALERLEEAGSDEVADLGFAEDATRRVRTDRMEV